MRTVTFPDGRTAAALGQGTWYLGDSRATRAEEIRALRTGLDLGMTLVDTAEMYGNGAAEELVGEAIAGRRDEVFLVSKVLPSNASRTGVVEACRRSLRRLRTDSLDLYLLHWAGPHPLEETIAGFEQLLQSGEIGGWGVSNFDEDELGGLPAGHAPGMARGPQTNQILYNLTRRGPEFDLLPSSHDTGMPVMAYSPIEQGRLAGHPVLESIAARHGANTVQIALAWVLRVDHVIAIPKAGSSAHVRENRTALDIVLSPEDLAELDAAFAPPRSWQPLEML
ncbi:aldo/keto reductase [Arthrobacter silvisoli]|uniref:aldo/keto reductase n=1 Tax=Arthrobacter silvisoli TaxID=2291022 RepID=UPI000E21B06B|nr:aldo/keto reductase [Arthrobacter silvisoli]